MKRPWIRRGLPVPPLRGAVQILRRRGVRGFWFRLLAAPFYRRVLLLERILSDPVQPVAPAIPLEIDQLDPTRIDEYLRFHGADDRTEVEARIAGGDACHVARAGGIVVGCVWATRRSRLVRYLGAELAIEADEVCFYDAYVTPEQRGKDVAPALHAAALAHYRDLGVRRVVIGVIPENRANLSSTMKTGFRVYARWGYVRIGRWRWDFLRPVRRR
jgi:GNAT superfamily N-acetyltransferase